MFLTLFDQVVCFLIHHLIFIILIFYQYQLVFVLILQVFLPGQLVIELLQ